MSTRFNLDAGALAELADSDDMDDLLQEIGDEVAERAREKAPKLTGAGAASIHCEVDTEDGVSTARVSWDAEHDYMGFAEGGTEHEPAQPFLRPALDETNI